MGQEVEDPTVGRDHSSPMLPARWAEAAGPTRLGQGVRGHWSSLGRCGQSGLAGRPWRGDRGLGEPGTLAEQLAPRGHSARHPAWGTAEVQTVTGGQRTPSVPVGGLDGWVLLPVTSELFEDRE